MLAAGQLSAIWKSVRSAGLLNGLLSAAVYGWRSSSSRPTLQGIEAGRGIGRRICLPQGQLSAIWKSVRSAGLLNGLLSAAVYGWRFSSSRMRRTVASGSVHHTAQNQLVLQAVLAKKGAVRVSTLPVKKRPLDRSGKIHSARCESPGKTRNSVSLNGSLQVFCRLFQQILCCSRLISALRSVLLPAVHNRSMPKDGSLLL